MLKTRSTLRLKNGAGILSADFVGVYALPLVAPLRVSLYWHFFCIVDHSALGGSLSLAIGAGLLPSSKTGVSWERETPVIN